MITYDLSGRTALVTGATRGIGKAMADALEAAGAKVVRTGSKDCDLSDRKSVYDLVERVKREHQIDILVNNAGTILRKPAAEHPDEWWDKVMNVNINAAFILAREFGRDMVARGWGKIVFTASLLIATKGNLGTLNLPLPGLVWGIINALSVAYYLIQPRALFAKWGSLPVTGLGMLFGGFTMLAIWLLFGAAAPAFGPQAQALATAPALDATGWLVLSLLVLVGTFGAFALYIHGVSIVGSMNGGLLGAAEPVSATLFSTLWLGTLFTGADWAGLILMVATILLVSLNPSK